eukprot:1196156-Prorocentrum_minimum.AAC.5
MRMRGWEKEQEVGFGLMTDQSDARRAGIFSRRTNQTQNARVYSHNGPIRRKTRGYILTTDQSDAICAGIFSRRTNQTQDARVVLNRQPRQPWPLAQCFSFGHAIVIGWRAILRLIGPWCEYTHAACIRLVRRENKMCAGGARPCVLRLLGPLLEYTHASCVWGVECILAVIVAQGDPRRDYLAPDGSFTSSVSSAEFYFLTSKVTPEESDEWGFSDPSRPFTGGLWGALTAGLVATAIAYHFAETAAAVARNKKECTTEPETDRTASR